MAVLLLHRVLPYRLRVGDDLHEGLLVVPKVPDLQLAVVEHRSKPAKQRKYRVGNQSGRQADRIGQEKRQGSQTEDSRGCKHIKQAKGQLKERTKPLLALRQTRNKKSTQGR